MSGECNVCGWHGCVEDSHRCWECREPFTAAEWELRHTDADTGEDVHADCCRDCPAAGVVGGVIHVTVEGQA